MKGQELQLALLDKNPLVVDPLSPGAVAAAAHVSAEPFLQQRWPWAGKRRLWQRARLVAALSGNSGWSVPGASGEGSCTPCPCINPACCLGGSRQTRHNPVPSAHIAHLGQSCVRGPGAGSAVHIPRGALARGGDHQQRFLLSFLWKEPSRGMPKLFCKHTSHVVLSTTGRSHWNDACLHFSFMVAEPRIIRGDT